jgi:hypothetical protein
MPRDIGRRFPRSCNCLAAEPEVERTTWRSSDGPSIAESAPGANRGVGYGVDLGLVATGSALATFLHSGSTVAGWGFAVAVVAASLAVVAVPSYG